MVRSAPPEAIHWPSGLYTAERTSPLWRSKGGLISQAQSASHSHCRTVPSVEVVTSRAPSGRNATLCTRLAWPPHGTPVPVFAFQTYATPASSAVATHLPSVEKVRSQKRAPLPMHGVRCPVVISHSSRYIR